MPVHCVYCMSINVEQIGASIKCMDCGYTWQPQNINPPPQITLAQAIPDSQLIATKKTTIGRLSGNILWQEQQVDSETINGFETTITRDFSQSSGGFLIHDPKDALGRCYTCGGILHVNGHSRCEYHSSGELLCPQHTYSWRGKKMCRRGYCLSIASIVLFFPFKLALQILGLIFLKEE